ncbi:S41 family peptidase [Acidiluteibacter ferrifornacis]|uniref:PDZ domain-containing protein n=1 Tax=Acidiluteibacter ferrifornacis TaxID=2692424 RepID=A0A6N9NIY1_9FLAO|nr:S41 family peptidase [Acidiluteibacter ferrifornacis]MBR9832254.1 S41 family peptidase [bacterium]NBG65814.1 PDZ domain-containing protein [Acidiluteibacter ferrifornacis]
MIKALKISFCAILLSGIAPTSLTAQTMSAEQEKGIQKFNTLLSIVNYAYVDTVNNSQMVDNAIVAVLKELDPHSVYIPKDELQKMNEPLEGNFEGIGIQFNILNDTITVVSPISGGPSEKLGIQSGDKIVNIEGELVAGVKITNSGVADRLRGKKGSMVNVEIKRTGEKKLLSFDIERDKIPIFSLDAAYMATPEIGYIKINRFARNTTQEFDEALLKLKKEGLTDLILDLRGNGGGYLNTAFTLADEFLGDKKLIVYTEGLKQRRENYEATNRGNFEKGRLVVLIDEGSASASEIVSGAIQDWDRGLIIGRRSFGKGLVQKPFPLPDGSAVRLTTAKYYTPTGRSIQKPYEEGKDAYYKDIVNRYKHGELFSSDSINFPDSLKYFTPNHRVVYGGGGIMPDLFVPIDTSLTSDYNSKLIRTGAYNQFILNYLDKNRKKLSNTYPTFKEYNSNFEVNNDLLEDFYTYAEKKKDIERNLEDIATSERLIKVQLKALLARNLFEVSEYFEVINELNEAYQEALKVLQNDEFMGLLEDNKK